MVCEAGLKDRSTLSQATNGTGPYQLTTATPGSSYTYKLRDGYTWGPDGATTKTEGMPAQIDVKVVSNETTAANELMSGQVNSAQILGPDAKRLDGAGLKSIGIPSLIGEQWYNEDKGHVTADPAVRKALTQALDLDQLQKVITSGTGAPATQLAETPPTGCSTNSVEGNLPATDAGAAASDLAAAGWAKGSDGILAKNGTKLSVTFLYDSALGSGGSAAAELVVNAWKQLGVDVKATSKPTAQMQAALFGSGDWDVAWEPINVNTPDQLVPFLSGPGLADGGNNFAGIANADYNAAVKTAMTKSGAEGCPDWQSAEAALFKNADIVPFASQLFRSYAKGATYDIVGEIVPTSIRMLG
jgi:peptide/nickel transport system substrate-binding protein